MYSATQHRSGLLSRCYVRLGQASPSITRPVGSTSWRARLARAMGRRRAVIGSHPQLVLCMSEPLMCPEDRCIVTRKHGIMKHFRR